MVSLYKNQLQKIEGSLDDSLKNIEFDDVHGRYELHRMAFNELMQIVKVYGPILGNIKNEYESLISHVIKTQQYARTMDEELRTACSYPVTILNYERKCTEQRDKLQQLRREKEHRLEQLTDIQLKCQSIRRSMESQSNQMQQEPVKARRELRRLPCMSLTSMTDLSAMQAMYDQLATQRQQMQRTMATRYVDKIEQTQLESQLNDQISNYDKVRRDVKNLIRGKFLMHAALTRVHSVGARGVFPGNVGEVILSSLIDSAKSLEVMTKKSDEDSVEEEINKFFPETTQPIGSMKESDYIVLCIQQFEKLFRDGRYREAADLAVVSPRGVLRNFATTIKFKGLHAEVGGSVMLHYCQQVIATMTGGQLDPDMSYECVDIALKEGRVDLVSLWISKGRLQSTELMADNLTCHADLVPDHKTICLDLAAAIYWDLLSRLSANPPPTTKHDTPWFTSRRKFFDSILECKIKVGRIEEAVEMLTNETSTPVSARSVGMMYKEEDLLLLLQYYPNIELVQSLINKELISLEAAFNTLLESESYGGFVSLLVKTMEATKSVPRVLDTLCAGFVNGINTDVWEWILNFVDESSEKMIMEIAASYLVKVSLERSCLALNGLGLDV